MLAKFQQWLRTNRKWRALHAREWSGHTQPAANGLTQFQCMAADSLRQAMPEISLLHSGKSETYLTGTVPGTDVKVFIYQDQAEVSGLFSGEHLDYSSPSELILDFVAAARRAGAA